MKKIKCSCGDETCKTHIWFGGKGEFWINDKENREHLMYIDANTLLAFINEAKAAMRQMYED